MNTTQSGQEKNVATEHQEGELESQLGQGQGLAVGQRQKRDAQGKDNSVFQKWHFAVLSFNPLTGRQWRTLSILSHEVQGSLSVYYDVIQIELHTWLICQDLGHHPLKGTGG